MRNKIFSNSPGFEPDTQRKKRRVRWRLSYRWLLSITRVLRIYFKGKLRMFCRPIFFWLFNNQDSRSNQLQLIRYIFLLGDNLLIAFSLPCKEWVSFNDGAFRDCFIEYYITWNILLQSQAGFFFILVAMFGGYWTFQVCSVILITPREAFNKHGISDDFNCLQNHKIQAPQKTVWI